MKSIPIRRLDSDQETLPSANFVIRLLEEMVDGTLMNQPLHRHDFFFILFVREGMGRHVIDFRSHALKEGSVFVLRPGQVHELHIAGDSAGYLVQFDYSFFPNHNQTYRQLIRNVGQQNHYQLDKPSFFRLDQLLSSILHEFTTQKERHREVITSLLHVCFVELIRYNREDNNLIDRSMDYNLERLYEFMDLLEGNIESHKKVSDYADKMSLSLFQLNRILKTTVGKTGTTLISDQIILESKRYLLATSDQVKDIAFKLGYEDTSYFVRFFRKHTGCSPEVFRQTFK